jgi:hypothetical protein
MPSGGVVHEFIRENEYFIRQNESKRIPDKKGDSPSKSGSPRLIFAMNSTLLQNRKSAHFSVNKRQIPIAT